MSGRDTLAGTLLVEGRSGRADPGALAGTRLVLGMDWRSQQARLWALQCWRGRLVGAVQTVVNQREIADRYGLDQSQISRVLSRSEWKEGA